MNGGDEEDPILGPRRPARQTNRTQRSNALTLIMRRNLDMVLRLAAMYLLDYQNSMAVVLSLVVVLSHLINNNAPAAVVAQIRLAIVTSLYFANSSLQLAVQAIQTGYAILFVRQSEHQENSNGPARKRTNDSLTEYEAYAWTRFLKSELVLLLLHLRLPLGIRTPNRYVFTGEEVLIFCLTRIALGVDIVELVESKFGGSSTRWSEAFNWFVDHVYFTFYHRITGDSMRLWINRIDEFRTRICHKVNSEPVSVQTGTDANGNPIFDDLWVNCDPATFRVFGFLDDTGIETCRPGGAWGFMRSVQRVIYR